MENGWQMKCGLKSPCSSTSLPSSSEQLQLQDARNQMNMNISHCILPHDAPGPFPPHLKQGPTSNILTFGSCKNNHPEAANSFHSLLSVPPSLSQYDFQRQLNAHTSGGGCRPDTSAHGNVGAIPNWPSLQNSANFNERVDVFPSFPSRFAMDMDNGRSHDLSNDFDALRSLVTHGGSKNGIGINSSFQKGVACVSSSSNPVPTASLQAPSFVSEKQISDENECPRVCCLGACGDLLLSSTGLFGVVCSCHGMRMSVSRFCEHAGLSDVNPGYAVRMDNGETIAQWRKEYLQKFGIRAPGDHIGWDWSEGLLTTSGLTNNSMPVADKRKVFDLSSLFNSSTESVKTTQPWKNLSSSRQQSSQENSNQTLKNTQRESGHDHFSTGSSTWISKTITDYPRVVCPPFQNLSPSMPIGKEERGSDCQSRSFNYIPSHENAYSSCQKLPSFSSKTHNNNKDDNIDGGNFSSGIELKLGQSWGSESSAPSAVRPHTTGDQRTIVQEKPTHNLANVKVTKHGKQNIFCHSVSNFNRTIEPFEVGPLIKGPISFQATPFNNALTSFPVAQTFANGTAQEDHVKDGLHHSLAISTPSSSTNSLAGDSLYYKEISKTITNSHPFRLQHQPFVDRSVLIDFACGTGDGVRNVNSNTIALPNNKDACMDATFGRKDIMLGSLTSSGGYAKKTESSGFTRNGTCNPNTSVLPTAKFKPLGVANMLSGVSGATEHVGKACNLTPLIGFSPLSAVLASDRGPVSCSKHVEGINSHVSVESSRRLHVLKNVEISLKEKTIDGSLVFNEPPKIHSDERQGNRNNPDLQKLFLDQVPLRRKRPPYSVEHIISSSFFPDAGDKKGMSFGPITEETKSLPELTDKYIDDHCHTQPKQTSSPSGQENTKFECDMVKSFSDRCKNNVQTMCSKMEQDYKGSSSIYGLKKQENFAGVETPKHSGSKLAEKETFLAYSQKDKNHALTLDCTNSQWIDASSKAISVSRMRCTDLPTLLLGTGAEPVASSKELSAEGTPRLNQPTELLKERELSDISSDCTVLAVTHASNEVNIIDQGSAISRSCSSVEAFDSVKSSQLVCDDKTISAEEESLMLDNIAHHSIIDEFQQTHSKSNELHNFMVSGGDSGEMFNRDENEKGFKPRKRKRTTKWKMLEASFTIADVSQLPSESCVCAGNASNHHASSSEDGQVLLQPYQNSSRMVAINSSNDSLKHQRSAMFSGRMLSRKRDLNGMYNSMMGKPGDHRPLNKNDGFIDMPESPVVNKCKQVKLDETVRRQTKTSEAAKGYWLDNRMSDAAFQKVKPIACGKYGILCDQESDIDMIKPPKIVPLSQVLKTSKRHAKSDKARAVRSKRKKNNLHCIGGTKYLDSSCNSRRGQGSLYYKVQSGHLRAIDKSTLETQQIDLDNTHIDDPPVPKDVGHCDGERKFSVSTRQSESKEARMRSLYELSIKGNKVISADINRSQRVMGVESTVSELATMTTVHGERAGESRDSNRRSCRKQKCGSVMSKMDELCCVCGISNKDNANWLLECGHCLIRIHQACYGISRAPKGEWYCRPCRTSSKDVACVLCGYGDGAMTRAFGSRYVVRSLLKAWGIRTEPHIMSMGSAEALYVPAKMECQNDLESATYELCPSVKPVVHNSIISGLFDPTVKQWLHMVCGLWTPGTRCPNVDTMSAFDVSGVSILREHVVCYLCKRAGGSCIKCRVETCCTQFHPWCAHQKGLLQSEVEGIDNDKVGFYGRCLLHADSEACCLKNDDADKPNSKTKREDEPTCARTQGYLGRKQGLGGNYSSYQHCARSRHLVSQVQVDAWNYIHTHKLKMKSQPKPPVADVDQDYRKEYARYKQTKGWKHLIVYKSGIHALGLYTSQFIQRGAMVVEYIGEIVGPRVADKRESEYLSGRKLQYKSACYFFRIDKEQIIDATCKGGIARFVNHSCQPNCVAKVLTVRGEKKVVFFAQRDINPGEEITYDYHFNHEDEGKKIPCFCNSKNCRRYLN